MGHCRRVVLLVAAGCGGLLATDFPCRPDVAVALELEQASLTPPPGTPPFEHWRRALTRLENLRARHPDDLFVLRRWTLLRRRLLLPAIPAPDQPKAVQLYLAGLVNDADAVALWTRSAETDPEFPWSHMVLATATEGAIARTHKRRFVDLCPERPTGPAESSRPIEYSTETTGIRNRLPQGATRLPIDVYRLERALFDRIRTTGPPASFEAQQAFWRLLLRASDRWIERWPDREFAWRDRLQALYELEQVSTNLVRQTADGALAALRDPDGVWFTADPTLIRIARAYVRHGVRLDQVSKLLEEALGESRALGDRTEVSVRGVQRDLAVRLKDAPSLQALLPEMRTAVRTPGLKPSERASRERDYRLAAAWHYHLSGQPQEVIPQLEKAFDARPFYAKRPGVAPQFPQPQNAELHRQGLELWVQTGHAGKEWPEWLSRRARIRINPERTDK